MRETRETCWGWILTSNSLSSAAFWSSVFHGNPTSSSNTAVNLCLIPPPSHLSGKLTMQLGMLTKCICAGEQWLMKVKPSVEKDFFFNFNKSFFIAYSSWTTEKNSSNRRTQGFAGLWWGGDPEPGFYCCSLLDMIPDLCKEQQIQQKRLAENDTVSPCSEGWKGISDILTFFIPWNSFFSAGPFQGDEGKFLGMTVPCLWSLDFLLGWFCRFACSPILLRIM